MKKLVAAIATFSVIFTGLAAINVSAEVYEVKEHDSLWSIAQKYDTSIQSLIDINKLNSTTIHLGQSINTTDETVSKAKKYTVKKGDTLSGIASKYNVNTDELME